MKIVKKDDSQSIIALIGQHGLNHILNHNLSDDGSKLLHVACKFGKDEIVARLISQYGIRGNQLDISYGPDKYTSLLCAAKQGHANTGKILIENGADKLLADKNGDTPFHLACLHGRVSFIRMMYNFFRNEGYPILEKRGGWGQVPILRAFARGEKEVVDQLLEYGAELDVADSSGDNPLHLLVTRGYLDEIGHLKNVCDRIPRYKDLNLNERTNAAGETPSQRAKKPEVKSLVNNLFPVGDRPYSSFLFIYIPCIILLIYFFPFVLFLIKCFSSQTSFCPHAFHLPNNSDELITLTSNCTWFESFTNKYDALCYRYPVSFFFLSVFLIICEVVLYLYTGGLSYIALGNTKTVRNVFLKSNLLLIVYSLISGIVIYNTPSQCFEQTEHISLYLFRIFFLVLTISLPVVCCFIIPVWIYCKKKYSDDNFGLVLFINWKTNSHSITKQSDIARSYNKYFAMGMTSYVIAFIAVTQTYWESIIFHGVNQTLPHVEN